MTAVSTALRLRYRQQPESAVVVDGRDADYVQWQPPTIVPKSYARRIRFRELSQPLVAEDQFDRDSATVFRSKKDEFAVEDITINTYRTLKAGDRITTLTDSDDQAIVNQEVLPDTLAVNDELVPRRSKRLAKSDIVYPRDEGFITDRDILRYRQKEDKIELVEDGWSKSITRAEGIEVVRLKRDKIEIVQDDYTANKSGVITKEKPEEFDVSDQRYLLTTKIRQNASEATDQSISLREVNRLLFEDNPPLGTDEGEPPVYNYAEVTDNVLVERSPITFEDTTTDVITMFDQALATKVAFVGGPTAKIKHGIELF